MRALLFVGAATVLALVGCRELDGLDCDGDAGDACVDGYTCNLDLHVCVPNEGCMPNLGQCGENGECVERECVPIGEDDAGVADAGDDAGESPPVDAGGDDAGYDAGALDAGVLDAGLLDAGYDAGLFDAGYDAGLFDAGDLDAGYDAGDYDAGPRCGDGVLQPELGEFCDDSNVTNEDGCSATCVFEHGLFCGVGGGETWEACNSPGERLYDGAAYSCSEAAPCPCSSTCGLAVNSETASTVSTLPTVVAASPDAIYMAGAPGGGTSIYSINPVSYQATVLLAQANGDTFRGVNGLAVVGDLLYIADSTTLKVYDVGSDMLTTIAGADYLVGSGFLSCPGGPVGGGCHRVGTGAEARFQSLRGPVWANGALWLLDASARVVLRYDPAADMVELIAGSPNSADPPQDGIGGAARFTDPRYMAWDGDDLLYISDSAAAQIRTLAMSTADVGLLVGEAGNEGYIDGPAANALLTRPRGIAVDGWSVYWLEQSSETLREMNLATSQVYTLLGQVDVAGGTDGAGEEILLDSPFGLALRPGTGDLWITESAGGRLRRVY